MTDFSRRKLCPDGSCVGVLDDKGRCPECGGGRRAAAASADMAGPTDLHEDSAPEESARASVEPGAFDPSRKLCPDGSCVGVISARGRCSECGAAG